MFELVASNYILVITWFPACIILAHRYGCLKHYLHTKDDPVDKKSFAQPRKSCAPDIGMF